MHFNERYSLMTNSITTHFIDSFSKISCNDWQRLNQDASPLLDYTFYNALEKSESVSPEQGWQPHHLIVDNEHEVIGILPMYLKSHSWGEYVFDWDWADAYERHGLEYYPKLVATIPFTPVTSNKLYANSLTMCDIFPTLTAYCQEHNINSWHILYCDKIATPLPEGVYERNTVQFHWQNQNYQNFDDFLNTFNARKRKNTRKERRSIIDQGLSIRQLRGAQISQEDIDFFYLTYQLTYFKRGHQPHLSATFFKQIMTDMADKVLLLIASDEQEDVACALFFHDENTLYGRYWGCTKSYNNLHFELCYYQGIDFCISQKLQSFNPGTQGEHKIQRGFEPVLTYSYHWIKHPSFKPAIKDFCQQEQKHMLAYQVKCQQLLPFRKDD